MARRPFAHDAVLAMAPGEDERAPGGAITVALCGSWEHEPPCPLAPHHTRADRSGEEVALRILFAAEPDDEQRVRAGIADALARGTGGTPDGAVVRWRLVSSSASEVRPAEREHADRLARG
ncbi:hypothetical protein ACI797_23385 [Geodermatophilus sp. SYSU D00691]